MARVKVYFDQQGNTLTVWFGDPPSEHICEETGDEVILMEDRAGRVIGFEKLNSHAIQSIRSMWLSKPLLDNGAPFNRRANYRIDLIDPLDGLATVERVFYCAGPYVTIDAFFIAPVSPRAASLS
jgi:hypothetical protein